VPGRKHDRPGPLPLFDGQVRLTAGRAVIPALRAGTLYAALDRLRADGLVTVDREEVVEGRLRRYYRLTDEGAGQLTAEVDLLRRRAEVAARRLAVLPGFGAPVRHQA
jgi:DNA-binding HxlR family transcriptional regulator